MSALRPKFYNAWFCPFAQRAWIGLLHKSIDFEYIEQDPYNKTPEWLAINPKGLVPVIDNNGKKVNESAICLEYIDEEYKDTKNMIMPHDPYKRAYARMWGDHVGKTLIPQYYSILMKTDKERETSKKEFMKNLELLLEVCDWFFFF